MFEVTKLISTIILPPFSIIFIWIIALLLGWFNYKKLSYFLTALALGLLYTFSLPYTAQKLEDSLVIEDNLTLNDYQSAQAIVVLGGGLRDNKELYSSLAVPQIALERLRYASYLYKETQLPILLSGSTPNGNSEANIMANELQYFFNTPTKWQEEQSKNTIENAIFSYKILSQEKIEKIILVTNQWHMQRAKLLFEKQGFTVLPASIGSGITPDYYPLNLMHFIPQSAAIAKNAQLIKEWLAYWKIKYF
ncbi:uncharacterized SAM-binding protein YcdF (DUF218 family) [Bisgaardia hudsonensis]|uniref:Uncharacterized SAM-binding protein YcdF (DUF218 family) n=1 Tax=Bisgaardia hudsonensis TaxID=109472 RepID=A0A4R2N153_9PAST|nr:YdcF family protein [Bisgaardia hudsonensis]QLB13181.1 hypothetical protein A6A11_05915 [Bisgaardia hudsonensis]TCP13244.1 uncharacterized SAM-binding protein YcdF (DUF218 family) [Bisgaardia hudsonensis]